MQGERHPLTIERARVSGTLTRRQRRLRRLRCNRMAVLLIAISPLAVRLLVGDGPYPDNPDMAPRYDDDFAGREDGWLLRFGEEFDSLNRSQWLVERSLGGVQGNEVQAYTDDPCVVFARHSRLVIQPRPMSADAWLFLSGMDSAPVSSSDVPFQPAADIASLRSFRTAIQAIGGVDRLLRSNSTELEVARCTVGNVDSVAVAPKKCGAVGWVDEPLPQVVSARLSTKERISVRKYGRVEIRMRLPVGDWIWPTVSVLPWPNTELQHNAPPNDPSFVIGSSPLSAHNRITSGIHCAAISDAFQISNTTLVGLEDDDGFVTIGLEWNRSVVRTYVRYPRPSGDLADAKLGRSDSANDRNPYSANDDSSMMRSVAESPTCASASGGDPRSPFDDTTDFLISLDVAVGGTTMHDSVLGFASRQHEWLATWTRPFEVDWIRVFGK